MLINLMNDIENDAYLAYINKYRGHSVEIKNVESDKEMSSWNNYDGSTKRRLVVFQSNKRILGLYFPKENYLSSSSSIANIEFKIFFGCLFFLIVIHRF